MKPAYDVTGMYKSAPVYLWVEDEETRTYLQTVWNGESHIAIYVAGGHGHIQAAVNAARNDGNLHVFGFRDRDFTASNRARWDKADLTVLASDAFEVENLLLDPDAIAGCDVNTANKTTTQIEQDLLGLAAPLVWWMSCRRTITEIRDAVNQDFLEHPPRGSVTARGDALNAIIQSPWWTAVLPSLHPTWGSEPAVKAKLDQHEATYREALNTGRWKQEFSGKEILRDLTTRVWTRERPPDPAGRVAFVQAIAEAQRNLARVPEEIRALRKALRRRAVA